MHSPFGSDKRPSLLSLFVLLSSKWINIIFITIISCPPSRLVLCAAILAGVPAVTIVAVADVVASRRNGDLFDFECDVCCNWSQSRGDAMSGAMRRRIRRRYSFRPINRFMMSTRHEDHEEQKRVQKRSCGWGDTTGLASISKRFLCSAVILVEPTDDSVTTSKGSGKLPANLVPAILNEWVAGVNGESGRAEGKNKGNQNECLLIENITTQRMARSRPNIVLKTE